MDLISEIKKSYLKWSQTSYKNKCEYIGRIIEFCLFIGVIFYAIGSDYLDFIDSILQDQLTFSEDFYENLNDDEKIRWLIIIGGFLLGVLLLPVIILHYLTQWLGMGLMYVVYKTTKPQKENRD